MEKRLIVLLSAALMVALLVIAFLTGRITSIPSGPPARAAVVIDGAPQQESPPVAAPQEEQRDVNVPKAAPLPQETAVLREMQPPVNENRTALNAGANSAGANSAGANSAGANSAIASYFARMDAIQVAGNGDPMTVAQGIMDGLQGGNTSAIDALVNGAALALAQATAVQPPPPCTDYHQRLIRILSEEAAGITRMRDAIKRNDVIGLSALGTQFQTTQQEIEDLDRIKKLLLRP